LRRRARQSGGEYELLDQPRSPVVEDDWRRSPFEAEGIHRSTVIEGDLDDTWGRPSAYDLRESMFTEQVPSRRSSLGLEPPSRRKSSTVQPIIDLDAVDPPISAQDEEIRSVIFNYAPTPTSRRSGASSPAHPISANPLLPLSGIKPDIHASPSAVPITLITPGQLQNLDESTTFSFLSLSQASSPTPHAVLGGMSSDRWAGFDRGSSEDDVVSLPDTITGGYEDAETYSPASRAMSPARVHSPLPSTRSPGLLAQDENAAAVVEEIVMSIVPHLVLRPRGPMSVVSLSESEGEEVGEGWGSEGEWGQ